MTEKPTTDVAAEASGSGEPPSPDPVHTSGSTDEAASLNAVDVPVVSHDDYEQIVVERDEFLNALQLVKADFDNYRKRVDRDRATERQAAGRDILLELLPVMDNLDRALAALGDMDEGVRAGVEMVRGQLAGTLAGRGITEVEAEERMAFDPNVHEAVVQSHSPGFDEGTVVAVVEKGYRHNGAVIRPARVVVAAAAQDA